MVPAHVTITLIAGFVLPLALALLARERALRGGGERVARWFSFARQMHLLIVLATLGWLTLAMREVRLVPAAFWERVQDERFAIVVVMFLVLAPVTLLPALLGTILQSVARQLETTRLSRRDTLARSAWLAGAFVVGSLPIGAGAGEIVEGRWGTGLTWMAFAFAVIFFCVARSQRGLRMIPHALTHGPLRDRLFEMASNAGVSLRQFYFLPVRRLGLANAFAVNGQVVMVTDVLLENLTRAEVDAVMAHEIAHLRRRDPLKLLFVRLGLVVAPVVFLSGHGLLAMGAAMLAGLAIANAVSQAIERAADRESLRLGGDGAALISGLVQLAKLGHVPLRWSRKSAWLLTHPSVEERARAIGAAAGLTPEDVAARLTGVREPGDHYPVPDDAEQSARLFTTPFKQREQFGIAMALLALATLVPAAVFAQARVHLDHPSRALLLFAALALGPVVSVLAFDLLAVQPLRKLRGALARRHGLPSRAERSGWTYGGLSPGEHVRLYEGFSNWDVGFARIHPDGIEFAGDQTRFVLPFDRIVDVREVSGGPNWIAVRAACLRWRDTTGAVHALRFTPLEGAGLHAIASSTRRWVERVGDARAAFGRGDRPAGDAAAPLPPTGEVTSQSPRAATHPRAFVAFLFFDLVLGAVFCALLGVPWPGWGEPGLPDILLVALATQVVLFLPSWRHRDPPPAPDATELPHAA